MEFVKVWFDAIWQLFSIKWPGFDFSIGIAFAACILVVIALSLVGKVFDLSFGGAKQKGGNNKRIKVSKERQNDTK